MYAKRTDKNHVEISAAFRKMGAMVLNLSRQGEGVPDLLVGFRGHTILVEVKSTKRATYTEAQKKFIAEWTGGMVVRVDIFCGVTPTTSHSSPASMTITR